MELSFNNLDLFSVGLAAAGMLILGFITFFNNPKSISNKIFLCLTVVASIWGFVNYSYQQPFPVEISFWLLKLQMFLGIWASFFTFTLAYVFPAESGVLSKYYKWIVVPLAIIISSLSLTPFVFSKVSLVENGRVTGVINGPGIILFGIMTLFFNLGGVVILIRKAIKFKGIQKRSVKIFLLGFAVMLGLIIVFNFILPAFLNNSRFIAFGAVFLLPFIAFTSYAIFKHGFLDVKIIAAEVLTFVLAIITFIEIILASSLAVMIFRSTLFISVLLFGILLIRSVRREVKQREELQKLTEELKTANQKLQELSRFKTQLLSLASHQLKSPLAAIKGFAEILEEGLYGPMSEKVAETVKKMKRSADELLSLVNTLLDLRRVEEGKMEYSFAPVDLGKLVAAKVDELRPLALSKALELKFSEPDRQFFVNADAQKLQQIIQNLIDNAIKYTPTGEVRVELEDRNDTVVFKVKDTGLGIAADLLPHLFEEFVRDERVKHEIMGTGFGLYIAKKIVEAHNGKIWAESAGQDQGSTFFMELKKIAVPAQISAAVPK